MRPRRVLVLSVSAGAGHVRAAQAICAAAAGFEDVVAHHIDVMEVVPPGFRKLYTDFYIALVNRHPAFWGYLYRKTNDAQPSALMQRLRRAVERLNTRRLCDAITTFAPDAIVCTHFLPAEILSHLVAGGRIACPVWVQVTDFDLHRMWVQPHMTGYFAASDEVGARMRAYDLAAGAVHVTGIPIQPVFGGTFDRAASAAALGIDAAVPTVLIMGGGAGIGSLEGVALDLLQSVPAVQVIVLAGKNAVALAGLQTLSQRYPGRLRALGFTNAVETIMACADLVVTKPGGLTTSECLAMGLPMIVNSPIPGQEERNADYLLEQGVALKAIDLPTLRYRVQLLIDNPEQLAVMRSKARRLGRPGAARQVLQTVLGRPAC
jgi:processive 1,2-diacylglycerol beta-glucosyltransferase